MVLKKISPNFWIRIKSGRQAGITFFLTTAATAGVIFGGMSVSGVQVSIELIITCGAILIILTFLVAYIRGKMKLLPDILIDEMGLDVPYVCDYCTSDNLREACELTKPFYGHEYVDFPTAELWRQANNKCFVQISNSTGTLCACFGILALTDSFMDQFILGRVKDAQLLADDICNLKDSQKCNKLYLSGIVVRDSSTFMGSKRALVMIWSMLMYLKKVYGLRRKRELYAISVTKESERLMKHLGFKLVQEGQHRLDKCNLYMYDLSSESWNKLLALVGDYSPMTTMNF